MCVGFGWNVEQHGMWFIGQVLQVLLSSAVTSYVAMILPYE